MADPQDVEVVVERIVQRLRAGPTQFYDLLVELEDVEYRDILLAWGRIRQQLALERDEQGRYLLPRGEKAAAPHEAAARPAVDTPFVVD